MSEYVLCPLIPSSLMLKKTNMCAEVSKVLEFTQTFKLRNKIRLMGMMREGAFTGSNSIIFLYSTLTLEPYFFSFSFYSVVISYLFQINKSYLKYLISGELVWGPEGSQSEDRPKTSHHNTPSLASAPSVHSIEE